jgi:hypothetical protein
MIGRTPPTAGRIQSPDTELRAATEVSARDFWVRFQLSGGGAGDPAPGSSGQRGLGQPQQVICLGDRRSEPIVLGAQPRSLELQCLNPGTQSGDLVEKAPVWRRTNVAVEGLRHIVSL